MIVPCTGTHCRTHFLGLACFVSPSTNGVVASSRVNQEMKAAATKLLEEEARVKADKEEKMTKFRDSACDAAARTIQQMYYVFSVSTLPVSRNNERVVVDSGEVVETCVFSEYAYHTIVVSRNFHTVLLPM